MEWMESKRLFEIDRIRQMMWRQRAKIKQTSCMLAHFSYFSGYFWCKIWRHYCWPRFHIWATKFRAYLAEFSRAHFGLLWGKWANFGLFSYFQCKIWRRILGRRPRFPIRATTFRAYLAWLSRSPFWAIWGFWSFLGYLVTSGAKSDVIFLFSDPDFLHRWRNFAPISPTFRDLTRDRQTDAATET